MCSALILVNVLIFALPMSTTQVVISGLTGVSIIFLQAVNAEINWFILEICLWVLAPIMGMLLAILLQNLMEKYILNHPECRKRILIITPYYMTLAFVLMLGVPLTKNYIYDIEQNYFEEITIAYAVLMTLFPICTLVIFRFLLIRKARNVENVKLRRKIEIEKDQK